MLTSHCHRCNRLVEGALYTVPVHLSAGESGWYLLCGDCFQVVLGCEPPDLLSWRILEAKHRTAL